MPESRIDEHSTNTHSGGGTQSLRASLYSLAQSVNTILPQYSASIIAASQDIEIPASFEQDIRGETYRFQILSELNSSSRRHTRSSNDRPFSHSAPPPRYSTILSSLPLQGGENNQGLIVQHYEHSFIVQSKRPWATLYIFTPESIPGMLQTTSQAKPDVPIIRGGEPVLGMLELDIESPKAIEQITISLQGKMSRGYSDVSAEILDLSYVLWHKSRGGSRQESSEDRQALTTKDAKLFGSHQLPFSFRVQALSEDMSELSTTTSSQDMRVSPYQEVRTPASSSLSKIPPVPTRSSVREKGQSAWSPRSASNLNTRAPEPDVGSTPLPPSFRERGIPASIEYTLTVRIQRRLRPDSTITTDVLFVPSTVANAASSKRQMAYASGSVSPGPYQDPEGWVALPSATIRGKVNERPIQIDCTLHLAEPRSYCRGTTIPCYLTFSSDDPHTLRLICNPKMPLVRLIRRLRQFEPRKTQSQSSTSITPFRDEGAESEYDDECILTRCIIVALAMWRFPSKDVLESLDHDSCYLEGEIHLQNDLQPSHSGRLFTIEYYVELLPLFSNIFKTSPMTKSKDRKIVLASSLVSITTLRAPGEPTPVTFSEPAAYPANLFTEAPKDPEWNNSALEQFGLI